MFTGLHFHLMHKEHTPVRDRVQPRMAQTQAPLLSGTVPSQVLLLMGGWGQGHPPKERDKGLQGYGISSIQKRGEEMELLQLLLGQLKATKMT